MKTTQKGQAIDICDICQQRTMVRKLARDHDHDNGERRGQLCHRCNCGIGLLKDDSRHLRRAAEYVEFWKMTHAGTTDCESSDDYSRTRSSGGRM